MTCNFLSSRQHTHTLSLSSSLYLLRRCARAHTNVQVNPIKPQFPIKIKIQASLSVPNWFMLGSLRHVCAMWLHYLCFAFLHNTCAAPSFFRYFSCVCALTSLSHPINRINLFSLRPPHDVITSLQLKTKNKITTKALCFIFYFYLKINKGFKLQIIVQINNNVPIGSTPLIILIWNYRKQ